MTASVLWLTLAYVAVAALLLNFNLKTRYAMGLKAAAIVVVSLLYFGAWHGSRGLMGWPRPDPLRVCSISSPCRARERARCVAARFNGSVVRPACFKTLRCWAAVACCWRLVSAI